MNTIRQYPLWQIEQSLISFARQLTMFRGIVLPLCSTVDNDKQLALCLKRLTENELIDFSRLWHDGCVKAIIEAQDVDRNHSAKV